MIFDTNFLIALQGRKKGFSRAQAIEWMLAHGEHRFFISRICELEFAAGFTKDTEAAPYLMNFTILPIDEPVLTEATEIMRELRVTGQSIGVADSIIAATTRLYDLPLVTDNMKHFSRIAGLSLRGYVI